MFGFAAKKPPESLYCRWLWHAVTVLCDGSVTCGLDDPFKVRNYGNLDQAPLSAILASAAIAARREALRSGVRCQACSMHELAGAQDAQALTPSTPYPKRLILEPSIKCNIRCRNETCDIANDAHIVLRRENFMRWELFCKLMDEVGPHLDELYFYNYGEPFLHPRALDMLAYAKRVNPRLSVTTSTNGILLARPGKVERIVAEGLVDFICFTIGGVDQESYARYHKAGSFDKALLGMRRLMEEKRRSVRPGPTVHWRYLLFNWNDSDAHIAEALRLRDEIGVDEFRFMLTGSPLDGRSLFRAPGTPGFEAIKPWLAYQEGYSANPFAEAGLWGAENCQWNGPFSWTGARASLVAKPKWGRVRLRLARGEDLPGPGPQVRVRLPWGVFPAQLGGAHWQNNFFTVPDAFSSGQVPVYLEIEKVSTPMRHGIVGDNRDLGVMVSLRDIGPAPNPFRVSAISSDRVAGCSLGA
jgi:hypothetical protein